MNFADVNTMNGLSPFYTFEGPQTAVQATVTGAIVGSKISDLRAPHPNCTWSLDFVGPALSCDVVNQDLYKKIMRNVETNQGAQTTFGYLAWTTSDSSNNSLPFTQNLKSGAYTDSPAIPIGPISPLDSNDFAEKPLSLYVAALPAMQATQGEPAPTIVECILQNVSYAANFSFINGVQHVQVEKQKFHNNVHYLDGVGGAGLLNETTANLTITTGFNTELVANFAYEAVMTAFNSLLIGDIAISSVRGLEVNTTVGMTPLVRSKELNFLSSMYSDTLLRLQGSQWNGLSVSQDTNYTSPMKDVLETMFLNATISLMSSNLLK